MKRQSKEFRKPAHVWQIQEAKAKFSQLVADATNKGYQTITKNGESIAIIMSKKEFDELSQPKMSLLKFFKEAPCPEVELDLQRSKDLPRDIDL